MTPIGKVYYEGNRPYCEGEEYRDRDGQKHEYAFVTVQYTVRFIKKKTYIYGTQVNMMYDDNSCHIFETERTKSCFNEFRYVFYHQYGSVQKWNFSIYSLAPPPPLCLLKMETNNLKEIMYSTKIVCMILVLKHILFTRC